MPDCGYCDASFDDEAAHLDHLEAEHADELGPIDRRRVGTEESGGLPTGPIALGVVLLAAAAVVGYVVFLPGGGSGAGGPTDLGAVHYHGTMTVVIDGERVDFSQSAYQLQADPFHFEAGDGERWHVHARDVTLAWAMDSLGIEVTAETVRFDGTTYDDADPDTTVTVTVDGEPVQPASYVLQQGDQVRIVVERG
ncbi:MAG: hypothetical protein U5J98_12335 [Halobacteriales archaeon]|nr:hypothetical protein [Halobacteriales archaeon]